MAQTDPIADFLTCVRNALQAKHATVAVPTAKIKAELAEILKAEGLIGNYRVLPGKPRGKLEIQLRYQPNGDPAILEIRRISRPGLRRYATAKEVAGLEDGISTTILTTSRGVMTNRKAQEVNVGGELICRLT